MTPLTDGVLTRRTVLSAAAVTAASTAFVGASSTFASAGTLPLVKPVWSERVRQSYGVCAHPNFQKTVYGGVGAWSLQLQTMGAAFFRGKYTPGLPSTLQMVERCRALGIQWLMLVAPEDWSMSEAELKRTLLHIRDHAADVCIGIEGINEPNHNRDGSRVRTDWAPAAVAYQRIIKEFVEATPSLSHVKVISPSLMLYTPDPYGDHLKLARAGVTNFIDRAGLHSYPGGHRPDNNLDERLRWVNETFGPVRTWITETGYTTALNSRTGHRPAPPDVAALYAPRAVLEGFSRKCKTIRYEMLDDPNPTNTAIESNFGLLECPQLDPSTWTLKPEFTTMKGFLASLKDTLPTRHVRRVPLVVDAPADVKWLLTERSNGTHSLLAYRNASVYDPVAKVRTSVAPASVTVTDRAGTRVVRVGAEVTRIPVR